MPGIIFQSVLIGGAYATGREIVEYGAKYGVSGIWSILAIGFGFSFVSMTAYEFARVFRVYDYRGFVRHLIGPLWPLFDVIFVVMAVVIIAVVSTASGHVLEDVLGWPYWLGVGLVIVPVGVLTACGRAVIERFKVVGSLLLYAGFLVFTGQVLFRTWDHVEAVFARGDVSFAGPVSIGTVCFTGMLYVGYNLAVLPSTFFVLDYQTKRRQTLGAGLITGMLAVVPFIMTYFAVLGYYPDEKVLGAPVPWPVMLEKAGGTSLLGVYALVTFWTLIETGTGLIHALIHRINTNLREIGHRTLRPMQTGLLTLTVLIAAVILSRFGIIDLVARGYGTLALGFLILFALPLLTIGWWRIMRRHTF